MAQCTATSKRTGERCRAPAVKGSSTCRMHGGRSLAGMASPKFKSGRYSKVLPAALRERYEEALSNDELLSLRDEVALLDARLGALFHQEPSTDSWGEALLLIEQRRKLVESEQKRLAVLNQYVSVEQIYTFVAAVGGILREHVTDRRVLAAIQRDLSGLLARPAGVVIDAE